MSSTHSLILTALILLGGLALAPTAGADEQPTLILKGEPPEAVAANIRTP